MDKDDEKIMFEDFLLSIIEKKRRQLEEYDRLSQSIYYEMFGDLEPSRMLQLGFVSKIESIEIQKELIDRSIGEIELMLKSW